MVVATIRHEVAVSRVAAAMGEPARVRMLSCLLDGRARTSTELAIVGGVGPSTASAHLARLQRERLVAVVAQGTHRYYRLAGPDVAAALESVSAVAGRPVGAFAPTAPARLRTARTCYDHMAGAVAVAWHDRLLALRWLAPDPRAAGGGYAISARGVAGVEALGIDVDVARAQRRRFAYACLDWSERRPHVGGALGAALLALAVRRRWVEVDLDSRVLTLTRLGRRELHARFGVALDPIP